ncbi:hypothetical protein D3C85_1432810 [compost metagenome]
MSIGNALKVGVAAFVAVKLATASYKACRDIGRVRVKLAFLEAKGFTLEQTIFATEAQLDQMIGEVK